MIQSMEVLQCGNVVWGHMHDAGAYWWEINDRYRDTYVSEDRPMMVYKKVRKLKDGNYYPLFIDKQKPFQFGKVMRCEYHPTKGFAPRSLDAETPIGGWHCCYQPVAPHIADKLKNGEERIWMKCLAFGKRQKYNRPESQGGAWLLTEYIVPLEIIKKGE